VIGGDAPAITAAGTFGEAGIAALTIRGESHRDASGLWLGGGALNIGRVNYSIVGSGAHASSGGLAQDISIATVTELKNGRVDARESLSIGNIAGGALKLGPMSLVAEVSNVPPEPFVQFRNAVASISHSTPDPRAQALMLQQKIVDLLVAIVKESPVMTIDLHAASPNGEAVGKATLGLSPDLANDPQIKAASPKGIPAQAWTKYGHASAEFVAPATFLAQLANADQLKRFEQSGILAHDGDNYVCRASFKNGGWLVNGRKIELPTPPSRSNPAARSS
jgi:hypothetical protein